MQTFKRKLRLHLYDFERVNWNIGPGHMRWKGSNPFPAARPVLPVEMTYINFALPVQ
jgi:hypothetical protein